MPGKYKRPQLFEKHSPESLLVLGTDTTQSCKEWSRRASKQTGIDCSFMSVYLHHMGLLFTLNNANKT